MIHTEIKPDLSFHEEKLPPVNEIEIELANNASNTFLQKPAVALLIFASLFQASGAKAESICPSPASPQENTQKENNPYVNALLENDKDPYINALNNGIKAAQDNANVNVNEVTENSNQSETEQVETLENLVERTLETFIPHKEYYQKSFNELKNALCVAIRNNELPQNIVTDKFSDPKTYLNFAFISLSKSDQKYDDKVGTQKLLNEERAIMILTAVIKGDESIFNKNNFERALLNELVKRPTYERIKFLSGFVEDFYKEHVSPLYEEAKKIGVDEEVLNSFVSSVINECRNLTRRDDEVLQVIINIYKLNSDLLIENFQGCDVDKTRKMLSLAIINSDPNLIPTSEPETEKEKIFVQVFKDSMINGKIYPLRTYNLLIDHLENVQRIYNERITNALQDLYDSSSLNTHPYNCSEIKFYRDYLANDSLEDIATALEDLNKLNIPKSIKSFIFYSLLHRYSESSFANFHTTRMNKDYRFLIEDSLFSLPIRNYLNALIELLYTDEQDPSGLTYHEENGITINESYKLSPNNISKIKTIFNNSIGNKDPLAESISLLLQYRYRDNISEARLERTLTVLENLSKMKDISPNLLAYCAMDLIRDKDIVRFNPQQLNYSFSSASEYVENILQDGQYSYFRNQIQEICQCIDNSNLTQDKKIEAKKCLTSFIDRLFLNEIKPQQVKETLEIVKKIFESDERLNIGGPVWGTSLLEIVAYPLLINQDNSPTCLSSSLETLTAIDYPENLAKLLQDYLELAKGDALFLPLSPLSCPPNKRNERDVASLLLQNVILHTLTGFEPTELSEFDELKDHPGYNFVENTVQTLIYLTGENYEAHVLNSLDPSKQTLLNPLPFNVLNENLNERIECRDLLIKKLSEGNLLVGAITDNKKIHHAIVFLNTFERDGKRYVTFFNPWYGDAKSGLYTTVDIDYLFHIDDPYRSQYSLYLLFTPEGNANGQQVGRFPL